MDAFVQVVRMRRAHSQDQSGDRLGRSEHVQSFVQAHGFATVGLEHWRLD